MVDDVAMFDGYMPPARAARLQGLSIRFSGASGASLQVAGRSLMSDLPGKLWLVIALWGLTPVDIGSPFGSPSSLAQLTISNLTRLTESRSSRRPSPGGRPGQHADLIASGPTAPNVPFMSPPTTEFQPTSDSTPSARALPPSPL
jgi:hypothetical protein